MKRHWIYPVLLVAAVWALFARTASFEFVRLDDHDYTFLCPFVASGFSWANVAAAFSNLTHAAIWMPVTYITYMADFSLFGASRADMGAVHLGNVFVHSVNAVLVFAFLTEVAARSFARPAGPCVPRDSGCASLPASEGKIAFAAFLAALWWAVHPLRVEPVCWIAGRKELLWTMFALAGLLLWGARRRTFGLCTAGAYACCALACLSKPTAMCFPALALCVSLLRDPPARVPRGAAEWRSALWPGILAYIPLAAMSAATACIAAYSQTHAAGYAERALFTAPLWWRALNAVVSQGLYLFQSALPVGLHVDRLLRPGSLPFGTVTAVAVLASCVLLAAIHRGKPSVRRAWPLAVFFLAAVSPVLGIFGSFGREAMADRFAYMPCVAIAAVAALALSRLPSVRCAGFLVYSLGIAVAAWLLVAAWRNDYTLFSRVLAVDPNHPRALSHVASEECARFRDLDSGIEHFRMSLALEDSFDTRAQLCYALARRGGAYDFAEVRRFGAAAERDHSLDRKGMMLEALGMAAMREGRWGDAVSCFEDSIKAPRRFYPADEARRLLAICRRHL